MMELVYFAAIPYILGSPKIKMNISKEIEPEEVNNY